MTMPARSLFAAIFLSAFAASQASAQEEPKKDRHAKLLEKYDKDGDGKLSEEEKAAAH